MYSIDPLDLVQHEKYESSYKIQNQSIFMYANGIVFIGTGASIKENRLKMMKFACFDDIRISST